MRMVTGLSYSLAGSVWHRASAWKSCGRDDKKAGGCTLNSGTAMIRPRPLGLAFGASFSFYHPSQPSPASIRPDLQDTPTRGHTDTDTPTCPIHACVRVQTSLSCQPPLPWAFAPALASWNSGIANAQDARTYYFLCSAPRPYPWWPHSGRLPVPALPQLAR